MNIRIISRLDIKRPNLVKGVQLEGLRPLGLPEKFAEFYYNEGADELFYQDIVASLYGQNALYELISKTSKNIFIPLTVGGGIRKIEEISKILRAGADKVSINSAAFSNPNLISKACKIFGSSTIAASIEVIKSSNGKYYAFTENGRNPTNQEVLEWSKKLEKMGVGEIILTSVDNEGLGIGFDIELVKKVIENVNLPVVIHGGAGNKKDILDLIRNTKVSGVAIASMFHYSYLRKLKKSIKSKNDNFNLSFTKFEDCSIKKLKKYLIKNRVKCKL